MDEAVQAANGEALLRQLSPEQVAVVQQVVRKRLLAELQERELHVTKGARGKPIPQLQEPQPADNEQLLAVTEERDEARNGRALAEQLLVALLRQLIPGQEPVYLFSLGVRELDGYGLNQVLAGYGLRLGSRPVASDRQINTRVGERVWDRRSLFWLERLPVDENAVPELMRAPRDEGPRPQKGEVMIMGGMWDYQVVDLSGVPAEDEATLNPYGLIGYELVAVAPVAATGRLVAYLKRVMPPEDEEAERP